MVSVDDLLQMADACRDESVQLLCDLIRIPSVNTGVMPTGDELPVCEFLQAKLAADGIASEILKSAPNRGNLVARLPGTKGTPRLLYMGHTDVVPVEDPRAWTYPPFGATIAQDRIWGRGAADMKDMVAAEAMALIILKRAGVALAGDLIFAAGVDEEAGGKYGFGWLAQHAAESIRADFAINEGGGGPLIPGAQPVYTIANGEKGRLEVHITLDGASCHAASPWQGDNVSFKLGEVLRRLQARQPELNVSHAIFDALPELLGRATPITIANVDATADEVARANLHLASLMRGMSRMTLVPTMFAGGVKSNSVPATCTLTCDVRTLPHQDEAYVRGQIEQLLAGIEGASYQLVVTAISSASPARSAFVTAIQRATERAIGRDRVIWLPALCTGFTDARLVRPLGVDVYGFGAGHPDVDPTIPSGAHGVDESTDIASLFTQIRMLLMLAYDVLRDPA